MVAPVCRCGAAGTHYCPNAEQPPRPPVQPTEPDADAPIPYALTPKAIAMLDRALYVPPLSEAEGQAEGAVST